MESQLIGPAAALATGFSDQFSAYNPYLTKLLVPHGASVFMICSGLIEPRPCGSAREDQKELPRKRERRLVGRYDR